VIVILLDDFSRGRVFGEIRNGFGDLWFQAVALVDDWVTFSVAIEFRSTRVQVTFYYILICFLLLFVIFQSRE